MLYYLLYATQNAVLPVSFNLLEANEVAAPESIFARVPIHSYYRLNT